MSGAITSPAVNGLPNASPVATNSPASFAVSPILFNSCPCALSHNGTSAFSILPFPSSNVGGDVNPTASVKSLKARLAKDLFCLYFLSPNTDF